MIGVVAKQPILTASDSDLLDLNTYYEEFDLAHQKAAWGRQGFVYKKIFDDGVASVVGSPVGEVFASAGGTVTPDQSTVTPSAIFGGGISQIVVAAAATKYGWVQTSGIGRSIMKTTGALAAGAIGRWSADDTVVAATVGTDGEEAFVLALVAASGGSTAAGGYRLFVN